jgi:hypothetical protein
MVVGVGVGVETVMLVQISSLAVDSLVVDSLLQWKSLADEASLPRARARGPPLGISLYSPLQLFLQDLHARLVMIEG